MRLAKGQDQRLRVAESWLPKYTEYAVVAAAIALLTAFGVAYRYGRISRPVATMGLVVGGAFGSGGVGLGIYRIVTPRTIPVEELDRQPLEEAWRANSPVYSPHRSEPEVPIGSSSPALLLPEQQLPDQLLSDQLLPGQPLADEQMPWDVAGDL
jgi:hypothetical protein